MDKREVINMEMNNLANHFYFSLVCRPNTYFKTRRALINQALKEVRKYYKVNECDLFYNYIGDGGFRFRNIHQFDIKELEELVVYHSERVFHNYFKLIDKELD